jgi:hypothetical protein
MTKLRAKEVVEGELEVLTGLHVGSAAAEMQIGSVDAPVVRDPITGRPYVPGSSLKANSAACSRPPRARTTIARVEGTSFATSATAGRRPSLALCAGSSAPSGGERARTTRLA